MALAGNEAFRSMLDQALFAFTYKIGLLCRAERASLFLVDRERGELWLRVAQEEGGRPVDVRMPIGTGIAGRVARSGVGRARSPTPTPTRTSTARSIAPPASSRARSWRVPLLDADGEVFAVAQLLNREDGQPFDADDEKRFRQFADSVGVILEGWWRMAQHGGPAPRAA